MSRNGINPLPDEDVERSPGNFNYHNDEKRSASSSDDAKREAQQPLNEPPPPQQADDDDGPAPQKKSKMGLLLGVVALILALVALGLSIYLALLWWYWPLCLTVPAATLALVAIIIAFAVKNGNGAAVICAILGILLSIAAIGWCSADIHLCSSYQGVYPDRFYDGEKKQYQKPKEYDAEKVYFLKGSALEKAAYYHSMGRYCKGECYDWSFRKDFLSTNYDCIQQKEEWMVDNLLGKDCLSLTFKHKYKFKRPETPKVERDNGARIDSYLDSPIVQTHYQMKKRQEVSLNEDDQKQAEEDLDEFCADFNVDDFITERDDCDEKLKDKFEPECQMKRHDKTDGDKKKVIVRAGYYFKKPFTSEVDILGLGSCGKVTNNGNPKNLEENKADIDNLQKEVDKAKEKVKNAADDKAKRKANKEWEDKEKYLNRAKGIEKKTKYVFYQTNQYRLVESLSYDSEEDMEKKKFDGVFDSRDSIGCKKDLIKEPPSETPDGPPYGPPF